MEDRLKNLIEGNNEANRTKWAKEWKKQDKKIIGVMSSYVPEEIISAAGMLPFRITGTWREDISHARVYRGDGSCPFCNHALESFLNGDLEFLDGVVIGIQDQELLRIWDVLTYLKITPFCYALHIPLVDSELNYQFFTDEVKKLIVNFQNFFGVKITNDDLRLSIDKYNKMRKLIGTIYEMRKRKIPPLSGAEVLGITTTAQIMPKDQFNQELEMLIPYLATRESSIKNVHPRLLITSEMLDNTAFLSLVEEACLVVMDDMDTGSRYFIQNVDTTLVDLIYALARRYIGRHGAPGTSNWDSQSAQIVKWVKEFNVDGVLGLPHSWCYPQVYRWPFLREKLEESGIPSLSLEREYHLANIGQLRTRIGAFLEMINVN